MASSSSAVLPVIMARLDRSNRRPPPWHQEGNNNISPQAPDRFNPKVSAQTCGIIQKLYETKHIETMTFGKSVMAHFSKIEPKTLK